jgi:hypothetical protein
LKIARKGAKSEDFLAAGVSLMRGLRLALLTIGAGCFFGGALAWAVEVPAPVVQTAAGTAAPQTAPAPAGQQSSELPVYEPPRRGAPASRISGATRGADSGQVEVLVLAPEATGLTLEATPTLYWYLSHPAGKAIEVTVIRDDVPAPLLDVTAQVPTAGGIQSFSLAAHRASLLPGIEYQWSVALILDPSDRSKDAVASGRIRRVEASPELRARLAAARPHERPRILAAASIWYDAIAELSAAHDPRASDGRAALLRQVGLADAASVR